MEREYISKTVLEFQPRSRRGCYRCLFGIRENQTFNKELFDENQFTKCFRNEFDGRVLREGQHIECMNLIVAVEQIQRSSSKSSQNTRLEFRLRGVPFQNEEHVLNDEEKGRMNDSLLIHIRPNNNREEKNSCYCPECNKCLSGKEFLIETENYNRPIVCSSCYESSFTHKCGRCGKAILFDQKSMRGDGALTIPYIEVNGSPWHLDCCQCVLCSKSLVGRECYRKGYDDKLYCSEECCWRG